MYGTAYAAGSADDIAKIESDLWAAGKAAAALQAPPRCADPKGYEKQVMAHITAAADNLKAGSGLAALLMAEAPLKNMKAIEGKLGAELGKTVGKNADLNPQRTARGARTLRPQDPER